MKTSPVRFAFGIYTFLSVTGLSVASHLLGVPPQYQIYDIGIVQTGDSASQGFGVSPGGVGVGRVFRTGGTQAFNWTAGGGIVGLPNLAGRNFCVSNSANDSGVVVGTGATTAFGSGRLPVIWQSGAVSQLPLPAGQTLGDANHVNASNIAVGSVNSGISQRGVIYNGASASVISQTTTTGCYFLTAFGINDSGRIAGQGIDPNDAARNVGIVYDIGNANAFEVGALPGMNGALAFGVSNAGHVVGSSMLNQGSGLPFIWSNANGIVAIPLAAGTSQGSARAVNSAGWAVGTDSSAFAIPFLYDGANTYRLADLLPAGSGWDLSMNTSSSALGISDNGIIVGTGVHNGETHGYAMVPVTPPTPTAAGSRKNHGAAGSFDLNLPLDGTPGIECRSGGPTNDHQMVITFPVPVTINGNPQAEVISGVGVVGSGGVSNGGTVSISGDTVSVPLTNVANAQTISVRLNGVSAGSLGVPRSVSVDEMISMSTLLGDTNGNGVVNATDASQTKARSGQAINGTNFLSDVNVNGGINATDAALVKSNIGTGLP